MTPPNNTTPPKVNANGHRRRQVVRRVKAEETDCALCGQYVDQTIPHPHPRSPVVDEDIPRSRGGSSYDRNNCHLMHRACNRWKGTRTLAEALAVLQTSSTAPNDLAAIQASPLW